MLYRFLLIITFALGLVSCVGEEDYEISIQGEVEALPEPEEEDDGDIAVNGGLEDSPVGTSDPDGWTVTAGGIGTASFEVSDEHYYDGSNSLKVSIAAPSENPWEIEAGPTGLSANTSNSYNYEAWVLGTPGATATFTASLNGDPWTTYGSRTIEVTNQWQRVEFRFLVPGDGLDIRLPVQLSHPDNIGVDIYLDQIKLIPEALAEVPTLPLGEGWRVNPGDLTLEASAARVSFGATGANNQLLYDITGPDYLEGTRVDFTISVDQDFLDSGANLQPFAQQTFGSWVGEWNCWINGSDLSLDPAIFGCTLDEGGAPFNLIDDTQSLQLGLQTNGDAMGTVNVHKVELHYPKLGVDAGWRSVGAEPPVYGGGGVRYFPTAEDHQLMYDITGPNALADATFMFTIVASQEFIDSGANLQPFAQLTFGSWDGAWGCWINNGDLSTDGEEYACTMPSTFNLGVDETMQIGVQAKGAPAGSILITNVAIRYAD